MEKLENIHSKGSLIGGFRLLTVFILLCAACLVIFWRPHLFFISDDWIELYSMSTHSFAKYNLTESNGEEWFPLFRIVFYGLIKCFRQNYDWLVLINSLGTGINSFFLFLLCRRHFSDHLSLILSLFYAVAAVHIATSWMAFFICYILSLMFLLISLLLTDRYLKSPSLLVLFGVGLCSEASIMFHNYPLLALLAIPFYALLVGGPNRKLAFWSLSGTVVIVLLIFTIGYLHFAKLIAVRSLNPEVLTSFPGISYWCYWFLGSFSYPLSHTFWGGNLSPIRAFLFSMVFLCPMVALIFLKGKPEEKGLAIWALMLNALPVLLVGIGRHQMSLLQSGIERYGIFSLIGALFLVGIVWTILARTWLLRSAYKTFLPIVILPVVICLQLFPTPQVVIVYREWNQEARNCYNDRKIQEVLTTSGEDNELICAKNHPFLTRGEAIAIHRFLAAQP